MIPTAAPPEMLEPGVAWLVLPLIILCLAMEGFFSGAEVALVSADRGRMRRRAEAGSAAARRVQLLMSHPEKLLSTTLIGTNLSVVTASFLANELTASRFGPEASAWSILLMIPFILLFGEILPKTISRRHPDSVALRVAFPLSVAMALLSPIVAIASAVARLALKPFHARAGSNPFVTKEELRMILQAEHRLALQHDEARLIKRLLDFADARAKENMTPLVDVASLPHDAKLHEAARVIHERGFSRLPVYTERVDNVTGLIEAMDLIDASPDETSIARYVKKPLYVPETARIDRLLDEFRKSRQEMAIVVDEYGSATGVLTLEDIVEEIVGDVLDEFDRPGRKGLERIGEGAFVADGKLRLDELEETLGIQFPRAGYETVAGLVTHLFQKVPRAGERLVDDAFTITVMDSSPRAVRRVKIEVIPAASPKPGPWR
ncbi:MAG TPA: hemolysin family protein [Candidatus Polarisedimenticolia bacterium]|nr:hemolysin family protein [Candidatus Polarisedimenticolia bacterium]